MSEPATERTAWATRDVTAPLRAFLRTESGSAGVLVAAIVAALVWANIDCGVVRDGLAHPVLDPARARGVSPATCAPGSTAA